MTDHAPPEGVADSVCTGVPDAAVPLYTITLTDGRSPAAVPAAPPKLGVGSFVGPAGPEVSVTAGPDASTVQVWLGGRWFTVVDRLTSRTGLVTSEMVPAYRATAPDGARGGLWLAERLPDNDPG